MGGTNVQVGTENCHVHNTTEFVMNGKTAKGPDLPMPISDACFLKINETFAILIGNHLSTFYSWRLKVPQVIVYSYSLQEEKATWMGLMSLKAIITTFPIKRGLQVNNFQIVNLCTEVLSCRISVKFFVNKVTKRSFRKLLTCKGPKLMKDRRIHQSCGYLEDSVDPNGK